MHNFNSLILFDIYERVGYNKLTQTNKGRSACYGAGCPREFGGKNPMKPQIVTEKMKKLIMKSRIVKAAVFAAIAAAALLLTGALYFRDTVYITDEGVTREIKTNLADVYAILKDESYALEPDDAVVIETDGEKRKHIKIERAFDVEIRADGETIPLGMTEGTVADALEKAGITLGSDDIVTPAPESELFAGMKIAVHRVEYRTRNIESMLAAEIVYKDNSNLAIGTENVLEEGENGAHVVTYTDKYVDGKFVYSEQTAEEITKQPVNRVVERGTACAVPYAKLDDPEKVSLVNGIPENYTRVVSGKATAYSARAGALTASGRYAVVGTVAVNPNIIPYGSEVYIVAQNGSRVYGYAIAADTGYGLMDGTVAVDVFMGSYEDSCRWGAVYVDIYVLSEGDNRYISASER